VGGSFTLPLDNAYPDRMTAPALRLLLLPFAALGDEAALGVWARQLPQLLGRSLVGSVVTIAPLWRDVRSGRLVRPEGALPQTVLEGEAEAAAADWVLTGAVAQTDEGLRVDLNLQPMANSGAAQAWCLPFVHGDEGAAFAALVEQLAARLGLPGGPTEPPVSGPLWPLLCDLEVEAELIAAGAAGLAKPALAWSHLQAAAASSPAPAWAGRRLAERRLLLQRVAPELLPAFDGAGAGAALPHKDLSTDEVLLLLGISSTATPPSTHG
jgi:hypothetical protein